MDAWNATDSTTANITVMRVPDYPPEANAGQDMVVYLPVKNVTLNGSLSTDDHGIVAWEWTKSSSDQNKAVDIQVITFNTVVKYFIYIYFYGVSWNFLGYSYTISQTI